MHADIGDAIQGDHVVAVGKAGLPESAGAVGFGGVVFFIAGLGGIGVGGVASSLLRVSRDSDGQKKSGKEWMDRLHDEK